LSVHGEFGHFQRQLGLWEARTMRWESPFDYATQGLLLVPQGLPLPSHPNFNQKFVDVLAPLIEAAPGGVLVLCTTLRAVDRITHQTRDQYEDQGVKRLLV